MESQTKSIIHRSGKINREISSYTTIKPFWRELKALHLIGVDPFPYPLKRFIKHWRTKYKHVRKNDSI